MQYKKKEHVQERRRDCDKKTRFGERKDAISEGRTGRMSGEGTEKGRMQEKKKERMQEQKKERVNERMQENEGAEEGNGKERKKEQMQQQGEGNGARK